MRWVRQLLNSSERRKAKAGKQLSVLLGLVRVAKHHRVRADFIALTLKQKQEYQVPLLRHAGLETEAAAVEALRWQPPVRPSTLSSVYWRVALATEKAIGAPSNAEEKAAATVAYIDASMSVKHAEFMTKKTWDENLATPEASQEVLLEAARMVPTLIQAMHHLRLLNRLDADRRIENALSEQAAWILTGFGQAM
jgi:hypothetical protein